MLPFGNIVLMKDRKSTEEQILTALDRLILDKGFRSLGVNAVAREASVSKVLIYRYFDSFEGLLETWALKNSYWTGDIVTMTDDLTSLPDDINASSSAKAVLGGYAESLRKDPIKREILRWFLAEKTEVGTKVMAGLEENGLKTTNNFKKILKNDSDLDIDALISLFSAGISYLSLLSDRADYFNGVELNSDDGWERLENTVVEVIKRLLD